MWSQKKNSNVLYISFIVYYLYSSLYIVLLLMHSNPLWPTTSISRHRLKHGLKHRLKHEDRLKHSRRFKLNLPILRQLLPTRIIVMDHHHLHHHNNTNVPPTNNAGPPSTNPYTISTTTTYSDNDDHLRNHLLNQLII